MVAFSEMLVPKTKVTKQSKHLVTRGCRVQGKKVEKQEKKEMMIHDAIRPERREKDASKTTAKKRQFSLHTWQMRYPPRKFKQDPSKKTSDAHRDDMNKAPKIMEDDICPIHQRGYFHPRKIVGHQNVVVIVASTHPSIHPSVRPSKKDKKTKLPPQWAAGEKCVQQKRTAPYGRKVQGIRAMMEGVRVREESSGVVERTAVISSSSSSLSSMLFLSCVIRGS
ncbi:hypothetical protein VTJ04DRAFT_1052 [Mycothermus thermophilus]|uniref:uncharacterized protein n=1 Tax=Humicola insolens TaxID=85995 RepID=UPI00374230F0